jgi:single-strand DNA-binding protein
MAGDTVITVIGNLTADPELRFTAGGAAVASFTVASTPSKFNRETNSWEDGEALFMRCSVWRQMAEHVTESLARGTRVIVSGRLQQRTYDTREGEKRTVMELQVDEVGPSLRYATAQVNRASRSDGGQQQRSQQRQQPVNDDPWASPPPRSTSGGFGGGFNDEPPF